MNADLTRHEQTRPETVQQARWIKPACDVYENRDEWLITADLPGVEQDALAVNLDKDELTIEARSNTAWFGEESSYAGYRRAFTLPSGIDGGKVRAELQRGVVSIHLPKSDAIKPRRIAVKAG